MRRSLYALLIASGWLAGCDSVLGISEPHPRAEDAAGGTAGGGGAAGSGAAGGAGGHAGGSAGAPSAGSAGAAGSPTPPCTPGARRCGGNVPETCEDGEWQRALSACESYCRGGACETPPSCASGLTCTNGSSCCAAQEVPGGDFVRDYDHVVFTDSRYQARISTFLLDRYEVTVGRFRVFLAAYDTMQLEAGAGRAVQIEDDRGWQPDYPLPASADELKQELAACAGSTWTEEHLQNETLPANCVSFYVAYAFCVWDEGRLPTEAEWNYAAAGGDAQQVFPWPDALRRTEIPAMHACYDHAPLAPVGSFSLGAGRWEHLDLAGNVAEWTLDFHADVYPSTECNDCLTAAGTGPRSIRGGGFRSPQGELYVGNREWAFTDAMEPYLGFRCARDAGFPNETEDEP